MSDKKEESEERRSTEGEHGLRILRGGPLLSLPEKKEWKKEFKKSEEEE